MARKTEAEKRAQAKYDREHKDGQVVVVERETFEKWVNHDFDYKAESEVMEDGNDD